MDLSNLSSNLPPTRPIDQASVNEVNRELAKEFKNAAKLITALYNMKSRPSSGSGDEASTEIKNKNNQNSEFANAAKSVASLYRLSNNSNGLNHQHGYLTCLNDLLQVISEEGDIENWALTQMAQFNKLKRSKDISNSTTESKPESDHLPEDFKLPREYEFHMGEDLKVPHQFRPSHPPMSVSHSQKQRANWLQLKKERESTKRKKASQAIIESGLDDRFSDNVSSEASCSEEDSDNEISKKRKNHEQYFKKRKEMKRG